MKRFVVFLAILGLLVGSVATAEAAKKKKKPYKRVFEATYDNPAPGIGGVLTLGGQGGEATSPSLNNERFLNVEIIDDSGQKTYFGVAQQDTNGDGFGEIIAGGCGTLASPLEIVPGYQYNVTVTMGPGSEDPTCPGIATAGTIKMTFTES